MDLFEARKALGGRAASYRDPSTGELVDLCQHVAMACCTSFHDFCHRAGIADAFERFDTLHFFGPAGQRYDLRASRWLPPPLHLAFSLMRQGYLTLGERLGIGRTLLQLKRERNLTGTIGAWLRAHGQSQAAIDRFWSVVLVSALGETVDRASIMPARKVFVDGFMTTRGGYCVDVPQQSLRELFDVRVAAELERRGVRIHRNTSIDTLLEESGRVGGLRLGSGETIPYDQVILALPWRRVFGVIPPALQDKLRHLNLADQISSSPITGVHLWFDRALTALPHAVLVDRLSQWVFRRDMAGQHYYQVVISASRDLSKLSHEEVVGMVVADLRAIFPPATDAQLLSSKVVTEREAVFSYRVGLDDLRPPQTTAVPNLFLAGDWTQTGWPSTLESAVRSGDLAAEALRNSGDPRHFR
jgi:squalene-associated FAD-dependent desaturase